MAEMQCECGLEMMLWIRPDGSSYYHCAGCGEKVDKKGDKIE